MTLFLWAVLLRDAAQSAMGIAEGELAVIVGSQAGV